MVPRPSSPPVPHALHRRRRHVRRLEEEPGAQPITFLPVAVVIIAAIVDVIFEDPNSGPRGIYGPLVVLVCMTLLSWRTVLPNGPLFLAVFACSYVHYGVLLTARFFAGPLPINVIDAAVLLAVVAELFRARLKAPHEEQLRRTGWTILAVTLVMLPTFIIGVAVNGPYEAFRDFRPFIFIFVAFFLTRRHTLRPAFASFLLQTMILAGIYSMLVVLIARVPRVTSTERYQDLRNFGYLTPTIEIAFVMTMAFVICGQSLFRNRKAMRVLFAIAVLAFIFLFSLSAYTMLGLVPALSLFFAPLRRSKKVAITAAVVALVLVVGTTATLVSSRLSSKLMGIAGQVTSQYSDPIGSVHVESRLATWTAALALVPGAHLLTGVGMGTHVFFDTGVPQIGIIIAGEPTYGNYLIASGLIGVAALFLLQLRLVLVSRQRMRASTNPYMRAMRLGLLVFGITTIVNSFIHNNFMTPQPSFLFGVLLAIASRSGDTLKRLETP
jgi:hypothetical protein